MRDASVSGCTLGGMHPDDFSITLGTDYNGNRVWFAACLLCGGGFAHMTWDRVIIAPLATHVHLDYPCIQAVLALSGRPGRGDDNILRAIGIPEEML